jgi:hypothetical protein
MGYPPFDYTRGMYEGADAKYLVDNLFMEWGAEAYKAGRKDLVAEMAKRA